MFFFVIRPMCEFKLFRESAEEQYKQQTGAGPDVPLGVGDKHFDPEKSETLKAIRAGEDDSFGKTFYEKIAQAEAPKVFIDTEPEWTEQARLKAERARSATPSSYAARQTPTPSYNPNYATIHGTSSVIIQPLCFYSNNQKTSDISYRQSGQWINDDRKSTPMYDISSVDSSKANISTPSSYHGHGPEHPRLQPKYTGFKKSNEMNIETAPNINNVSANVFVGDTVSNQKIYKENVHKQKDPFGTSFAPPEGFKEDHKTVSRQENSQKFGTYSLSAYKPKPRSYSAAPMDRYDSSTYGTKEVTVETLLNDTALYPRKKLELPYWHSYSLEKQDRWKNGSDPRLSRPQVPKIFHHFLEVYLHSLLQVMPQIPVHQPPYWYNQANQTHNIWQTAADRNTPEYSTYGTSYSTETRQMQDYTTGYKNTINSQHYQEQRQFQPQQQHYKEEEYKLEKQTINSQNTSTNQASYHENTAIKLKNVYCFIANTEASTQGNYTDTEGREVSYTRELVTSVDPHRECSLLKEEERRVVETPYEPGIISR
uniref:ZM domain-containing protein n=1 Tax=Syphacia muris TaxID=451379 RepID=A0A0N5A9N4_9BILA